MKFPHHLGLWTNNIQQYGINLYCFLAWLQLLLFTTRRLYVQADKIFDIFQLLFWFHSLLFISILLLLCQQRLKKLLLNSVVSGGRYLFPGYIINCYFGNGLYQYKFKLASNRNTIIMSMIPLFVQSPSKQQQQATSDIIPDSALILNPQVEQLLDRPGPICLITAVVHSKKAKNYLRSMFFQAKQNIQLQNLSKSETITMYNKLNVGFGSLSLHFNWVYFEVDTKASSKLAQMITSISFDLETDRIYLEQAIKKIKLIFGRYPSICFLRQSAEFQMLFDFKTSYTQIILPGQNSEESAQLQIVHSIAQNERKIFGNCFDLQNKKGQPISSAILPKYFQKWDIQSNFGEVEKPQLIWDEALNMLEDELKIKCLQEYKSRMSKLYEDKKFVSIKLLRNSHDLSMQIAIKSIEKYKIWRENFIEQMQVLINEQLNKILQHISEINLKWGKSFIQSEFNPIEMRLKNKEVKLISSLKHQFAMLIQYFRKKTESLSCRKLQHFFQQYAVEKAIDCCGMILENEKKQMEKDLTQMKNKWLTAENQIKQVKRQLSKQSSEASNNVHTLQQKINYYKNRQQLLENTIAQLKNEKNEIDDQYDNRITEIEKSFMEELNELKESKVGFTDEIGSLRRKIALLEADIEKQRQMHKQTQQHYKIMISQFKYKQSQLKEQISDITIRAGQQLEEYRRDSMRQLNQSTISKTQKDKQGQKLIEQLSQANHRYAQLQKAYNNLQYQSQIKRAQYQIVKNDLEIALKIAEQRVCEYESRMPRYQKLQQQVIISQKMIQQSAFQRKGVEKQIALLKQQNAFVWQQCREFQIKFQNEKDLNLELKSCVDELQQKVSKLDTVKVNEWVQTEFDHKLKRQLEDALHLTAILESEYKKVKLQNSRLKYRLQ